MSILIVEDDRDLKIDISPERPDVLLLVSHLRNSVPGQVLRDVRQESPESRLVFVNLVDDDRALLSAVREGAEGVLDVSTSMRPAVPTPEPRAM